MAFGGGAIAGFITNRPGFGVAFRASAPGVLGLDLQAHNRRATRGNDKCFKDGNDRQAA